MPPGSGPEEPPAIDAVDDCRPSGEQSPERAAALNARVHAEQVALLFANAPPAAMINALAGVLAWLVILPSAPSALAGVWLSLTLAVCAGRFALKPLYTRYRGHGEPDTHKWERRMIVVATATGICWGLFGALFAGYAGSYHIGFSVFVLGGMTAAGVVTLGPLLSAYLGFSLPIMAILVAVLLMHGGREYYAMAGLTVGFEIAVIVTARRVSELIRRNIQFRLTNENLVHCLSASNRKQAEVNRKLEHEIQERIRAEARVEFLATHDALTGLPNRRLQHDRFRKAAAHAARNAREVALLFIDLDYFKEVNDTLGHPAGDALLCEIANRLRDILRGCDSVCRQGGDEFVLLLGDIDERQSVEAVATRVLNALSEPVHFERHEIHIACSIGISLYPEHGDNFDLLNAQADKALYRAKRLGRGRHCYYDPKIDDQASPHVTMEEA